MHEEILCPMCRYDAIYEEKAIVEKEILRRQDYLDKHCIATHDDGPIGQMFSTREEIITALTELGLSICDSVHKSREQGRQALLN